MCLPYQHTSRVPNRCFVILTFFSSLNLGVLGMVWVGGGIGYFRPNFRNDQYDRDCAANKNTRALPSLVT